MNCCVVGCGPAGIIAAKYLKQAGIEFDVFEMTDDIGGTWIYTENKTDSYGSPVHTAMYKSLRTNLPKEIMEFEGFKFDMEESFIDSSDIYRYLKHFVNENKLMDHVKLGHLISNVSYKLDSWEVLVKNLKNNTQKVLQYNAIMVCNGHYSNPRIPEIEGQDTFEGLQMHSKSYRVNDIYRNKNLLIIGFAYSGQDIADDTSKVAKKVFLSHHSEKFKGEYFRNTIIPKPDVKKLNRNSVTFEDGTTEDIDAILYCTGYLYTFPFLDESCGISVDDNYVKPLYRQFININHSSMAFIGLPSNTFVFPLLEVQVRAFVKLLLGQANLPKENEMWEELQRFECLKIEKGIPKRKYHQMENVRDYVHMLKTIADLEDLPLVLYKILDCNSEKRKENFIKYRYYNYKKLDDNNFTVYPVDNKEY